MFLVNTFQIYSGLHQSANDYQIII